VKEMCRIAEAGGKMLRRLSIGQPSGAVLESVRLRASELVLQEEECWWEYQDNGFVPFHNWARRFVQAHVRTNLADVDWLVSMPTPGTKPMLKNVIIACGLRSCLSRVYTMTEPGYAVPATWSGVGYLNVDHQALATNSTNGFLVEHIELEQLPENALLMLNYPHNPSGQAVGADFWRKICEVCERRGVRVVNDAAYTLLGYNEGQCCLTDIAVEFSALEHLELFSISKEVGNGTGARVGAAVGTKGFMSDFGRIKGNDDSGFVAPIAAAGLYALEEDKESVYESCHVYQARNEQVVYPILTERGMRASVRPQAGFFSLWDLPQKAFGQDIVDAKQFNELMIAETGLVGVHFGNYMRYAVCGPVEDWRQDIIDAFDKANVSY